MNTLITYFCIGLTLVLGGMLLFASIISPQDNHIDEVLEWQRIGKVDSTAIEKTNSPISQISEMPTDRVRSQGKVATRSNISNDGNSEIFSPNFNNRERRIVSRRSETASQHNSTSKRESKTIDPSVGLVSYESGSSQPRSIVASKSVRSPIRENVQPNRTSKLTSSVEVEKSALARVRYGKSLARRGAFFAAKEEFTNAMYLVSEAYDRTTGKSVYSELLKAALLTLDEVESFERSNRDDSSKSLEFILSAHHSGLVPANQAPKYTRHQLVKIYLQSAKRQLEQALGDSPAASESLFSMGKLLTASPNQNSIQLQVSAAIFQAAFTINPHNAENTNELGVKFLRTGHLAKAKEMLLRAVQGSDSPVYWNNLAEVHRRMANASKSAKEKEMQLTFASQAVKQAKLAASGQHQVVAENGSNWVSAKQFYDNAAVPDMRLDSHRFGQQPTSSEEQGRGFLKKFKKWF